MRKKGNEHARCACVVQAVGAVLVIVFCSAQSTHAQWIGSPNIYYNGGNVGIGTNNPTQQLSVGGNIEMKGNSATRYIITDEGATGSTRVLLQAGYGSTGVGGALNLWGAGHSTKPGWATIGLPSAGSGNTSSRFTINDGGLADGNDIFTVLRSGNVGIGTTSPSEKFEVVGHISLAGGAKEIRFKNASGNAEQYVWHSGTSLGLGAGNVADSVFITHSGDMGIGTNSPSFKLDVRGIMGVSDSGGNTALWLRSLGSGGRGALEMYDTGVRKTAFYSDANDSYINGGGKLGIGTATPTEKLEVYGNIKASGTIYAKYQDVAEWVPSSERLATGTVVVLDSTKSNQVISSTRSYDTRVAGVVSEKPGIALGEKSDGKVLVATTGRVKVKVDATKSPIQIGDLLVTSDIPGVAMKSEAVNLGGVQIHRPGTLIGKALEPLAKGKGEILVLLSLQ